jgi:hypothetical protein
MADINTIPKVVNITHYGGDTLTLQVLAPAELVAGLDWNAQVRPSRESDVIDGTFDITPPAVPNGPAYVVLQSEVTSALVGAAAVVRVRAQDGSLRMIKQYAGVWDLQVSAAGDDPVTTLVQGSLTIQVDVTRLVGP